MIIFAVVMAAVWVMTRALGAGPDLFSAGPFSEKCGGPFTYFFLEKTGDLFLLITLVHSGELPIISGMQKTRRSFCGGPCLAEHA